MSMAHATLMQKVARYARDADTGDDSLPDAGGPKPRSFRKRLALFSMGRKGRKRVKRGHLIVRKPTRHRTLFISDTHLGTPGCKAELLADFLRHNEAQTLYLVGDIIDGWRIRRAWYWNDAHNHVIQEILRKARKGTRVIYVPGNHDEALRDYVGVTLAGVEVINEDIHRAADGKSYLVLHGDQFDGVVRYAKWLAHAGDRAYNFALACSSALHSIRRALGLSYWSLSGYLKHKVKNAVEYISKYEDAVAREARDRGVDGVVCGHIHHAEIREMDGVIYMNDGDWVESCTALAEDDAGNFTVLHWTRFAADVEAERAALQARPSCADAAPVTKTADTEAASTAA
ncbi:UDP-2,3-diacylglucosamine diphosphatase [Pyruvatibacter sp.]|uniref:UDP-2,3-diacylglucosamine diphosphatase n=1 Tax=Pyruvatibacter sp. TaxID=1981328 RepID=UPI0032EC63C2